VKKRALWKDIVREIRRTKARFLSIFAIIMLGVSFFAGIKSTGPDMLDTAGAYYQELRLMDLKVQSTLGLTQEDADALRNLPQVREVEPGYSADVFIGDSGLIAKVHSYDKEKVLNRYRITAGRLPGHSGEIVLDDQLRHEPSSEQAFALGDSVTFSGGDKESGLEDDFRTLTYTVVGFALSPQYIESSNRGTSVIGKGTVDIFAVIPEADFLLPVYTEINLGFTDTAGEAAYTPAYEALAAGHADEAGQVLQSVPERRLAEVKAEGEQKLAEGRSEIAEGERKLAEAEGKLAEAKRKLDEGRLSYEQGADQLAAELAKGEAGLTAAADKLAAGRKELERSRKKLADGQAQLDKAQAQLAQEQAKAEPQLKQGAELAASLKAAVAAEPGSVPEEQQNRLTAGAAAADAGLGSAVAGYFAGTVDRESAQAAVAGFEQGLKTASGKLQAAQQEIGRQQRALESGKQELRTAEAALQQGEADLAAGTERLAAARQEGEAELASAKNKLEEGQREYDEGLAVYKEEQAKAGTEIASAKAELAKGEQELDRLKQPQVYVFDRTQNPGYAEFQDNADRLSAIATAFPVFFFLIAALVSLTTMTRMVEEQRLQIGTLKALGYGSRDIIAKFLVYGTLASIAASAAGLAVGFTLFPTIIYNAYSELYNLPQVRRSFYLSYSVLSVAVALICTSLTAVVASRVELRSNASVLMRPKSPKSGQRILLERITPLWKRLSFVQKVTARNLFRYKQRMFMTVIGVAGCTALILTGFGIKDSIGSIAPKQFGSIMKYNALVAFHEDGTAEAKRSYEQMVSAEPAVTGTLDVTLETVTAKERGVNNQEVRIFVPAGEAPMDDFVTLRDRTTGEAKALTNEGAVVTEKLANLYSLVPGDMLTVMNNENEEFQVKVAAITENYVLHYMYMTPAYYESVFAKVPEVNTQLLNYSTVDPDWEDRLGEKLTANERVAIVSFSRGVGTVFEETMKSMDVVIVVLIVSAAALAFVVLYNLTNINVSERIRELSTIKVLGFYDKEVTMYIYRENILLTLLGIIFGGALGVVLHGFVLGTAELDATMFAPVINGQSYIYAALLTLIFSGVVMVFMHSKLKHIHMIEALKSVE